MNAGILVKASRAVFGKMYLYPVVSIRCSEAGKLGTIMKCPVFSMDFRLCMYQQDIIFKTSGIA